MTTEAFSRYRGRPGLPVSFEYPAGWQVEESTGSQEVYTQVQVYAPGPAGAGVRTYLVVRVVPPPAAGGRYGSAADAQTAYRETLLPDWQIEQESTLEVLGAAARRLEVSGTLRLPWHAPEAEVVPVRSQRVFCEAAGGVLEMGWVAPAAEAGRLSALFDRLLQTLALAAGPPDG